MTVTLLSFQIDSRLYLVCCNVAGQLTENSSGQQVCFRGIRSLSCSMTAQPAAETHQAAVLTLQAAYRDHRARTNLDWRARHRLANGAAVLGRGT